MRKASSARSYPGVLEAGLSHLEASGFSAAGLGEGNFLPRWLGKGLNFDLDH